MTGSESDSSPEPASDRPTVAPFLGALAIFVLVVIGIVLFNVFGTATTTPGDQVAQAAVGQNDAMQRQDYGRFRTFTCRADQGTEASFLATQRDSVAKHGERFVNDVPTIRVDGERASATVIFHFANTAQQTFSAEVGFVREDGSWKVCSPRSDSWRCGTLAVVSYAGDITPEEAWKLLVDDPGAVLVDCRTSAEWRFVGVPDTSSLQRDVVYVEWNRNDGTHNDAFVEDLLEEIGLAGSDERPVVFLCRSGNRSIGAAEAATEAGIAPSYNVLDGFEGNLDSDGHRGVTGWKAVGLPWRQS